MDRLQWLRDQIAEANRLYYDENAPQVDDIIYDEWKAEYRRLLEAEGHDPESDPFITGVGHKSSSLLEKAEHNIFMGSLDNSMTQEEFLAFDKRVGGGPYYCNPKVDGASIALYYKNGILEKAITRGDGQIGDDITDNVRQFKNLPKQAGYFTGAVRGEAILFTAEWEQIDPDGESNPRNIGSGIIQRSDGRNNDKMRLLAFDIVPDGYPCKTEIEKIDLLGGLGFDVPLGKLLDSAEDVVKAHAKLAEQRTELPYWIDGYVVKVNDVARQLQLGVSGRRPRYSTAFKFTAERARTKVLEIIWTVGHTGAQIPTARVEPVRLGGTTVQNVLLCNMEYIKNMDVAEGDIVEIIKAGEIIPRCVGVISRVYECPSCGFRGTLEEQELHHAQKH